MIPMTGDLVGRFPDMIPMRGDLVGSFPDMIPMTGDLVDLFPDMAKLSASLDCHFWIALWYSLTFSYRRLTFFPNCIWTPTFSATHNILASVV